MITGASEGCCSVGYLHFRNIAKAKEVVVFVLDSVNSDELLVLTESVLGHSFLGLGRWIVSFDRISSIIEVMLVDDALIDAICACGYCFDRLFRVELNF